MISTLILLSAGVVTSPVFISDVKASREAGHLRVEVRGDGGIDPEEARTVIDDGRLIIYLGGTRVRADNRSWSLQDGAGEIRAHRHRTETELVVPLTGNGCSGPVELTGSDTGITALVGCDGTVAPPAPKARVLAAVAVKTAAKPVVLAEKLKAVVELPEEDEEAAPSKRQALPVVVEAKVAEPLPRVSAAVAAPPAAPPAAQRTPEPATVPAATGLAPALNKASAALPATNAFPATAETQPAPTGGIPASSGGGGIRAVGVPALLLAALAVAAYLLARRRRGSVPRHIQILETTSLGPKRSIVVARVGDETLILGSSEAGITLLKGTGWPPGQTFPGLTTVVPAAGVTGALPVATAKEGSTLELDQPLQEALADIPEPRGQRPEPKVEPERGAAARAGFRAIEGGLAGLFDRRGDLEQNESLESFEDLLEDSVEDQELRRKLAAGMSARVR